MAARTDSDERCLQAIRMTVRFALRNAFLLAMLILAICMLLELKLQTGVNIGLVVVIVYFVAAYRFGARDAKETPALAGFFAFSNALEFCPDNTIDSSPMFNPATGLAMYGNFETMGNPFGFNIDAGATDSEGYSLHDDGYSINPASGLPMVDDTVDIHGNIFGTNSIDSAGENRD